MSDRPRDEIIEEIALIIEEGSFADLRGSWAKRKRGREDADLVRRAVEEERRQLAMRIRSYKSGNGNDPMMVLERIAEAEGSPYRQTSHLVDAWPLAWKGWVTIECTVKCNSNSSPLETRYDVRLTETGREILASAAHEPATSGEMKGRMDKTRKA